MECKLLFSKIGFEVKTSMSEFHGFMQSSEFYDDKNFPKGFKRSGDFTIAESEILSSLGSRLAQLKQKKVAAETDAEKHFLEMCEHNLLPESVVERVWAKYENIITTGKPKYTLTAKAEDVEDDPDIDDDDL
ncbi:DUF413 domain-containing protein [Psychrosphaera algicola]|uniref:Macrodomain Ori protein n=1 Tax=Psychrosphaera algicola TaxID=3023714 RepID=A0ABT5FG70_9GAMM|nr:DUF413 domain-containing protein [Psychrosphaera sp. G1-22]MDC2890094.1 DUF413 domain-containing protein [Psychrosphaera sp. G1-22]